MMTDGLCNPNGSSDLLANRKTIIISTEHIRPDIREHQR